MKYKVTTEFLCYKREQILDDSKLAIPSNWLPYLVQLQPVVAVVPEVKDIPKPMPKPIALDLNKDGVVDHDDSKIASKVMNEVKSKKRGRPRL